MKASEVSKRATNLLNKFHGIDGNVRTKKKQQKTGSYEEPRSPMSSKDVAYKKKIIIPEEINYNFTFYIEDDQQSSETKYILILH